MSRLLPTAIREPHDPEAPSWLSTPPGSPARLEALVIDAIKRHHLRSISEISRHAGIGYETCRKLLSDLKARGRLNSLRICDNVGDTKYKRRKQAESEAAE